MPRTRSLSYLAIPLAVIAAGCFTPTTRTVYLRGDEPVRLAEPTKAKVWADSDNDGIEELHGPVELSEGSLVVPPPEDWEALGLPDPSKPVGPDNSGSDEGLQ